MQLSYYHPRRAGGAGVYVQTSPDVVRVTDAINRLSVQLTGGKDMSVMYDSATSWPLEWYFRDYTNKSFQPNGPTATPGRASSHGARLGLGRQQTSLGQRSGK